MSGLFELRDREAHVWPVRLDGLDSGVAACYSVLSPDEAARAGRFVFEHLRREFTIAHGLLRYLLARYLDALPEAIEFAFGAKDKPEIARPVTDVRFNMSHSHGMALYAVTRGIELGVDIEQVRALEDAPQIAQHFFCKEEAAELARVARDSRERAFFLCWTRKEAYIKAVGDGLSLPLDSFQVTLQPGDPARFVHLGGDRGAAQRWTLDHLDPAPNYVGALAYHDTPRPVRLAPLMNADEALRCFTG